MQEFFYFTTDHDSFVMFYQLSFILRSRNKVMKTGDKYVITGTTKDFKTTFTR